MKIPENVFSIENEGRLILYNPIKGSLLEATPEILGILREIHAGGNLEGVDEGLIKKLQERHILEVDSYTEELPPEKDKKYQPTSAIFLPTFDCNLRCIYCYSRAGEEKKDVIDFDYVKSGIDFIVANAKELGQDLVKIDFHGGGEPLLPFQMDLVKKSVNYFRDLANHERMRSKVSATTNGIIARGYLEWIIANFDDVNLSFDGPEDIQNLQRPLERKGNSYPYLLETIRMFDDAEFNYSIRSTITEFSVERMSEMVQFFYDNTKSRKYHFEPLSECGRCKTTLSRAPDSNTFTRNLIDAFELADKLDVNLHYSGSCLDRVHINFCGANGRNFIVTPEGNVSTCIEVSRESEPGSKVFFIGKYNPQTHSYEFDEQKIDYLRQRTVDSLPHCNKCFAKFNCSGDCLAQSYSTTQDLFDTSKNPRCQTNRELLRYKMNKLLD
ncbi:MAG: radical SAM protein [Candidatus Pacearchaeota archaeon]|jgi:uncharacterized protein